MFLTLWILGLIIQNLYEGGSFTVTPVKEEFIVEIVPPYMNVYQQQTFNPADFTLVYNVTLTQYENHHWKSVDRISTTDTHIELPKKGDWASIIISVQAFSPQGIKSNQYIIGSKQIQELESQSTWPYLNGIGKL
jgi:hypothetical protein